MATTAAKAAATNGKGRKKSVGGSTGQHESPEQNLPMVWVTQGITDHAAYILNCADDGRKFVKWVASGMTQWVAADAKVQTELPKRRRGRRSTQEYVFEDTTSTSAVKKPAADKASKKAAEKTTKKKEKVVKKKAPPSKASKKSQQQGPQKQGVTGQNGSGKALIQQPRIEGPNMGKAAIQGPSNGNKSEPKADLPQVQGQAILKETKVLAEKRPNKSLPVSNSTQQGKGVSSLDAKASASASASDHQGKNATGSNGTKPIPAVTKEQRHGAATNLSSEPKGHTNHSEVVIPLNQEKPSNDAPVVDGAVSQAPKSKYPLGTKVYKEFPPFGWFSGEVVAFDGLIYKVTYEDDDSEDLQEKDLDVIVMSPDDLLMLPEVASIDAEPQHSFEQQPAGEATSSAPAIVPTLSSDQQPTLVPESSTANAATATSQGSQAAAQHSEQQQVIVESQGPRVHAACSTAETRMQAPTLDKNPRATETSSREEMSAITSTVNAAGVEAVQTEIDLIQHQTQQSTRRPSLSVLQPKTVVLPRKPKQAPQPEPQRVHDKQAAEASKPATGATGPTTVRSPPTSSNNGSAKPTQENASVIAQSARSGANKSNAVVTPMSKDAMGQRSHASARKSSSNVTADVPSVVNKEAKNGNRRSEQPSTATVGSLASAAKSKDRGAAPIEKESKGKKPSEQKDSGKANSSVTASKAQKSTIHSENNAVSKGSQPIANTIPAKAPGTKQTSAAKAPAHPPTKIDPKFTSGQRGSTHTNNNSSGPTKKAQERVKPLEFSKPQMVCAGKAPKATIHSQSKAVSERTQQNKSTIRAAATGTRQVGVSSAPAHPSKPIDANSHSEAGKPNRKNNNSSGPANGDLTRDRPTASAKAPTMTMAGAVQNRDQSALKTVSKGVERDSKGSLVQQSTAVENKSLAVQKASTSAEPISGGKGAQRASIKKSPEPIAAPSQNAVIDISSQTKAINKAVDSKIQKAKTSAARTESSNLKDERKTMGAKAPLPSGRIDPVRQASTTVTATSSSKPSKKPLPKMAATAVSQPLNSGKRPETSTKPRNSVMRVEEKGVPSQPAVANPTVTLRVTNSGNSPPVTSAVQPRTAKRPVEGSAMEPRAVQGLPALTTKGGTQCVQTLPAEPSIARRSPDNVMEPHHATTAQKSEIVVNDNRQIDAAEEAATARRHLKLKASARVEEAPVSQHPNRNPKQQIDAPQNIVESQQQAKKVCRMVVAGQLSTAENNSLTLKGKAARIDARGSPTVSQPPLQKEGKVGTLNAQASTTRTETAIPKKAQSDRPVKASGAGGSNMAEPKETDKAMPQETNHPRPQITNQPKPQVSKQPKPQVTNRPRPQEPVKGMPKELVKAKPKETIQATPKKTNKSEPLQTKKAEVVPNLAMPKEPGKVKPRETIQATQKETNKSEPSQTKKAEVVPNLAVPKEPGKVKPKETIQATPKETSKSEPSQTKKAEVVPNDTKKAEPSLTKKAEPAQKKAEPAQTKKAEQAQTKTADPEQTKRAEPSDANKAVSDQTKNAKPIETFTAEVVKSNEKEPKQTVQAEPGQTNKAEPDQARKIEPNETNGTGPDDANKAPSRSEGTDNVSNTKISVETTNGAQNSQAPLEETNGSSCSLAKPEEKADTSNSLSRSDGADESEVKRSSDAAADENSASMRVDLRESEVETAALQADDDSEAIDLSQYETCENSYEPDEAGEIEPAQEQADVEEGDSFSDEECIVLAQTDESEGEGEDSEPIVITLGEEDAVGEEPSHLMHGPSNDDDVEEIDVRASNEFDDEGDDEDEDGAEGGIEIDLTSSKYSDPDVYEESYEEPPVEQKNQSATTITILPSGEATVSDPAAQQDSAAHSAPGDTDGIAFSSTSEGAVDPSSRKRPLGSDPAVWDDKASRKRKSNGTFCKNALNADDKKRPPRQLAELKTKPPPKKRAAPVVTHKYPDEPVRKSRRIALRKEEREEEEDEEGYVKAKPKPTVPTKTQEAPQLSPTAAVALKTATAPVDDTPEPMAANDKTDNECADAKPEAKLTTDVQENGESSEASQAKPVKKKVVFLDLTEQGDKEATLADFRSSKPHPLEANATNPRETSFAAYECKPASSSRSKTKKEGNNTAEDLLLLAEAMVSMRETAPAAKPARTKFVIFPPETCCPVCRKHISALASTPVDWSRPLHYPTHASAIDAIKEHTDLHHKDVPVWNIVEATLGLRLATPSAPDGQAPKPLPVLTPTSYVKLAMRHAVCCSYFVDDSLKDLQKLRDVFVRRLGIARGFIQWSSDYFLRDHTYKNCSGQTVSSAELRRSSLLLLAYLEEHILEYAFEAKYEVTFGLASKMPFNQWRNTVQNVLLHPDGIESSWFIKPAAYNDFLQHTRKMKR